MMQRHIVKYPGQAKIGTIEDQFPFEIRWNRNAKQADKDTFAQWLSEGITTTGGGRDDDGTANERLGRRVDDVGTHLIGVGRRRQRVQSPEKRARFVDRATGVRVDDGSDDLENQR